jgi:hypothetical protein
MEDVIKTEAKDFVISGIEKASGQYGINIEVSVTLSIVTLLTKRGLARGDLRF